MKTIAFCNSTLAWGGGENWHLEAALYMAEQGYNVIMLAHEKGALYDRAKKHETAGFSVKPLSIGRLSFLNPLTVCGYARLLKENNVDTVIMNLPQDLKCMGFAAKKAGIPRIIYRRGSALPVRNSTLNRLLYGRVLTGLIVNSEATKREVYRHNASLIPEERVMVIPNGIDIDAFEKRLGAAGVLPGILGEKDAPATRPDGDRLCGRPVILGNAGRLNKQKGQHYLLYLAKTLESLGVDYRLVIAGSGERREELESLSHRLGVAGKVHFCGFLDDTSPFWKTIDIFVLSSLWEGFGYVLLEAMLSAKPILAFGVSNIPELVEDGLNGFLFPLPEESAEKQSKECCGTNSGDIAATGAGAEPGKVPDMTTMAEAVRRLAEDDALRLRMGEAGRAFANPAFDQRNVMKKLVLALESGPLSGSEQV